VRHFGHHGFKDNFLPMIVLTPPGQALKEIQWGENITAAILLQSTSSGKGVDPAWCQIRKETDTMAI
jgi:hypothetical protein